MTLKTMSEENVNGLIVSGSVLVFLVILVTALVWVNNAPYRFALQVQENTLACYDKVGTSEAKALCGPLPTAVFPKD